MDDLILPPKLLKPKEVALILGVSRTQIYRLLQSEIPILRVGPGSVRVSPSDLDLYMTRIRDAHGRDADHHV